MLICVDKKLGSEWKIAGVGLYMRLDRRESRSVNGLLRIWFFLLLLGRWGSRTAAAAGAASALGRIDLLTVGFKVQNWAKYRVFNRGKLSLHVLLSVACATCLGLVSLFLRHPHFVPFSNHLVGASEDGTGTRTISLTNQTFTLHDVEYRRGAAVTDAQTPLQHRR